MINNKEKKEFLLREMSSLEDKKLRVEKKKTLYEQFKQRYPQFFGNYTMPMASPPLSLQKVDLSAKQMSKIPISVLQKSVLCGTCLGDSSLRIQRNYKNARIQSRHSTRQSEWFFWKWTVCLKDYTNGVESITFQNPDGYQLKTEEKDEYLGKLKISTKADPRLTALHSIICKKNRENVERSWLNHMTDYFLMTVWLDDGSLFNSRQGVICLDSLPLDQQEVFVNYLKSVWGIKAYCRNTQEKMKNGQDRHRICIQDQESLLKLLRIVAPIIPVKEMLYKVMFVPINDTDLLQRWASEVSELVLPEFRDYVKEHYKKLLYNYPLHINVQGSEGPKDRRTEGPKDRRTEGPKDRRTEGPKDRRKSPNTK
jgi:hypothetical protein